MSKRNDLQSISYLLLLVGHRKGSGHTKGSSLSSLESLCQPNVADHLGKMIRTSPLVEDLYQSETSTLQHEVEASIRDIYTKIVQASDGVLAKDEPLDVEAHLCYVEHHLQSPLPAAYYPYDTNHAWMVYWLVNSKALLEGELTDQAVISGVSAKVGSLVIDSGRGGIAGGPFGQMGHVASTYAGVLSLVVAKDHALMATIRRGLHEWFLSLKHANGSFSMHEGGECDTRSTYCVLSVAALLGMLSRELVQGTLEWILSCQTYEGGFAGVPDTEAHGGYTYCAVASLVLLQKLDAANLDLLVAWLAARQLPLEGGFCGRTNKLVDGCYSFWVGASLCMVEAFCNLEGLFDRGALKSFILNCCQAPEGGLRDKPGKRQDFYHTNYVLCGLSLAEHTYQSEGLGACRYQTSEEVDGAAYTNAVNPVFGLPCDVVEMCHEHFENRDVGVKK